MRPAALALVIENRGQLSTNPVQGNGPHQVNANSCACSCKRKSGTNYPPIRSREIVLIRSMLRLLIKENWEPTIHQPGLEEQSSPLGQRDPAALAHVIENRGPAGHRPGQGETVLTHGSTKPAAFILAKVKSQRGILPRVLHPPSSSINPVKENNQPSQANETSCVCSCKREILEGGCTRRGMHTEGLHTEENTHGREYTQREQQKMVHDLTGLEGLLANI